ncbi:TRADD-N-associated membrane domain-containing protein [Sphaerisporangium rhizosphaerae]|uniref:Cyanobacterial TRADD-N associated 2 transmembrane domain-containing protein n=1 Tax=Sphaerisporangium rhizosphaerae TaxID=2269375 RepID=A0ABW2P0F6_9ACTN
MDGTRTHEACRAGQHATYGPLGFFPEQLGRATPFLVSLSIFVLTMTLGDLVLPPKTPLGVKICLWVSLLLFAIIVAKVTSRWRQERIEQTAHDLQEIRIADEPLREGHLELSPLWTATQSRMNFYHNLAINHARQSFRAAQIAILAGFAVLLIAVTIAVTNHKAAGVAAALGAISAALGAYIARTFLRSQETAAGHLHTYFDQPVRFSRYLAVERLINEMKDLEPDQRAAISGELLRTIIAPDMVPSGEPSGAAAPPEHDGSGVLAALSRIRRAHGAVPRKP